MKKITFVLLLLFSITTVFAQNQKINPKKSTVKWTGKKVTGEEGGTVKFKEGNLELKNGKIVGGNFVVNMTTLNAIDSKGQSKQKLESHLKSKDFFNTSEYKTANLVFKSVKELKKNNYKVVADLTIKGKTNPVSFELEVVNNVVKTNFEVDRTKYGIQYGSGSFFDDLGDQTIYDNFDLNVVLVY